jgi:hypothetical protein
MYMTLKALGVLGAFGRPRQESFWLSWGNIFRSEDVAVGI